MKTSVRQNPALISYCAKANRVWKKIKNRSISYLEGLNPGRRNFPSLPNDKARMTASLALLAIRVREGRSRSRDNNFRHTPIGSFANRQCHLSLILQNGVWEIEHGTDKVLRLSYGSSPDLEWFIEKKDSLTLHGKINQVLIGKLRKRFGRAERIEERLVAICRDNLSLGCRADALLCTKNYRYTWLEVYSRVQLSDLKVMERIKGLTPLRPTDKVLFIALGWTVEAEDFIRDCKGMMLATPTCHKDQISFRMIVGRK